MKRIIIGIIISVVLITIGILIYGQMTVKNIFIDIDYGKSTYLTSLMRPAQNDLILVTTNSKVTLTKQIKDKKLLNGSLKWKSSDNNIIEVNKNDTLNIKQVGTAEIYCESILGTKSNIIRLTVVEEGEK